MTCRHSANQNIKGMTQALDKAFSACSDGKYETRADFIICFKNDVNGTTRNLE